MVLNCIPPNQQLQIKTKNDISLLEKSNYYLMMLEEDFLKKQKVQFEKAICDRECQKRQELQLLLNGGK